MQVLATDRAPKVRNMSGQGIALVSMSKEALEGCKPETWNHISYLIRCFGLTALQIAIGHGDPGRCPGLTCFGLSART